jgi:glucan phosphoethanolaminetransferase (alkaline phosphatase superfamily)
VFEEILGVPAHPLLVHAAVVFVPLLIAAALAYALVPALRGRVGWAVALLAVAAPLAAWFATLSGNRLQGRLIRQGAQGPILDQISNHKAFGERTLWFCLALAVVALLLVLLTRSGARRNVLPNLGSWPDWIFLVVILALAAGTAYYVFKTGDTGAKAVWGTT